MTIDTAILDTINHVTGTLNALRAEVVVLTKENAELKAKIAEAAEPKNEVE